MRQSQLFTKTRKESPKDEVSKNADLLIRAGFIHKEMAGVYDYLPLGLRVLNKIEQVIREEMNAIGGQEIEMASLQDPEIWKKADKWDDEKVDIWFKTKLKNDTELGLAFSHEEVIAEMLKGHIASYKDLPLAIYQFQTKFRNELRAKSGIMRGREFVMKDMYSFSRSREELYAFYEKAKLAYAKVFDRVGLGEYTYVTAASGGVFGEKSHEFQTLSEAGEDTIYLDEQSGEAINEEIYTDEKIQEVGLDRDKLVEKKSIEVGNIFPIEDLVAKKIGFSFTNENGEQVPVYMGSYGIGLGRVMGTIAEVLSDEKGLVWPAAVAPYQVHLVRLGDEAQVISMADEYYELLTSHDIEVLYDDRDLRAGEKFNDSDLMGIPMRLVVSAKSVSAGEYELIDRQSGKTSGVSESALVDEIKRCSKE